MYGKKVLVFVLVLCSANTRHLYLCCDWTNEESLAAAFRNSRQNRQNTGARIQSFIVPFECGHIGMNGFWTFGSTFQIFFHMLIFPPVKLMNVWGTSMKSELRSKQNCFVHCFEFASEVISAVTPFIAIFTCYTVAAAQCRMEEKRHVKVSTYGCIFGNFNYPTQFYLLSLV